MTVVCLGRCASVTVRFACAMVRCARDMVRCARAMVRSYRVFVCSAFVFIACYGWFGMSWIFTAHDMSVRFPHPPHVCICTEECQDLPASSFWEVLFGRWVARFCFACPHHEDDWAVAWRRCVVIAMSFDTLQDVCGGGGVRMLPFDRLC